MKGVEVILKVLRDGEKGYHLMCVCVWGGGVMTSLCMCGGGGNDLTMHVCVSGEG
jgi:hypothetical protein